MTKAGEDKIISDIIVALGTYALGNIRDSRNIHKPPISINMMLAVFILCSCFIDQMAQIRYYKENGQGNRFRKFVKKYFGAKYTPRKLYDSLRSRLVHNYSVKGKYWLAADKNYKHLEPVNGRVYLNIDDFIEDIEIVWKKFKKDLLHDPETRMNAFEHERKYPILKEREL